MVSLITFNGWGQIASLKSTTLSGLSTSNFFTVSKCILLPHVRRLFFGCLTAIDIDLFKSFVLENSIQYRKVVNVREVGLFLSEKPELVSVLGRLKKRARDRVVRKLYPLESRIENIRRYGLPGLSLYLTVENLLGLFGVILYPVRELKMGFEPRLHELGVLVQELRVDYDMSGHVLTVRPELLLVEEQLSAAVEYEPRHPGFDSPCAVYLLFNEQGELVRIFERYYLYGAAFFLELVSVLTEPVPQSHVLRITYARRRELLPVKVLGRRNTGVLPHYQSRAPACGARYYTECLPVRFYIPVDGGVGPYVRDIELTRKEGLNSASPGIKELPVYVGFITKC